MTTRNNMPAQEQIVGVWEVYAPEAPFQWHMMTFTPFGTMSQSNPHEGNRDESDSSGHGIWEVHRVASESEEIIGKFVEFKANRTSGHYIGKAEIHFTCIINDGHFKGTSDAYRYDENGKLVGGPFSSPISGTKVQLDTTQ
jgi:hypothetical protein